jgi:hypothetical protein
VSTDICLLIFTALRLFQLLPPGLMGALRGLQGKLSPSQAFEAEEHAAQEHLKWARGLTKDSEEFKLFPRQLRKLLPYVFSEDRSKRPALEKLLNHSTLQAYLEDAQRDVCEHAPAIQQQREAITSCMAAKLHDRDPLATAYRQLQRQAAAEMDRRYAKWVKEQQQQQQQLKKEAERRAHEEWQRQQQEERKRDHALAEQYRTQRRQREQAEQQAQLQGAASLQGLPMPQLLALARAAAGAAPCKPVQGPPPSFSTASTALNSPPGCAEVKPAKGTPPGFSPLQLARGPPPGFATQAAPKGSTAAAAAEAPLPAAVCLPHPAAAGQGASGPVRRAAGSPPPGFGPLTPAQGPPGFSMSQVALAAGASAQQQAAGPLSPLQGPKPPVALLLQLLQPHAAAAGPAGWAPAGKLVMQQQQQQPQPQQPPSACMSATSTSDSWLPSEPKTPSKLEMLLRDAHSRWRLGELQRRDSGEGLAQLQQQPQSPPPPPPQPAAGDAVQQRSRFMMLLRNAQHTCGAKQQNTAACAST